MKKRTSRILSLTLLCAMVLGLLAGCSNSGGNGSDSGDNGSGEVKDTITVATMAETPSVSPYDHNATAGYLVNLLTFTSLVRLDENLNAQPDLAESFTNISDTCWEFKLRQDVKFHDGSSMTAEDVKASLDYAKTFTEGALYNDSIESVEVVDEYTVRINTKVPDAALMFNLAQHANAIVPKALIDSGNDFNTNPIGTGPYVWKEWKRGDQLEFEAFADYYLGEPAIKNVIWKIIPEGSSRTIALEAGEIDFIVEVEAMDYDRLKEADGIALYEYDATEHNWLMLNNEKPGLDNENVRKAMDCAIDKESIITVALNGMGTAVYSQAPNNLPGASEENVNSYDAEKAKEYMDASGVDPASIEMSIITSNDTKKRAAEVIQANLNDVLGITATIESMDLATYLSTTAEGNYTASIGNYTSSDMISYLVGVFHSKSINASNKSRLNDPEIDALIDQATATMDQAEREALTEQICAKLNEICTQAPLYQPTTLRAYNSNLQGVEVSDSGYLYFENVSWAE